MTPEKLTPFNHDELTLSLGHLVENLALRLLATEEPCYARHSMWRGERGVCWPEKRRPARTRFQIFTLADFARVSIQMCDACIRCTLLGWWPKNGRQLTCCRQLVVLLLQHPRKRRCKLAKCRSCRRVGVETSGHEGCPAIPRLLPSLRGIIDHIKLRGVNVSSVTTQSNCCTYLGQWQPRPLLQQEIGDLVQWDGLVRDLGKSGQVSDHHVS